MRMFFLRDVILFNRTFLIECFDIILLQSFINKEFQVLSLLPKYDAHQALDYHVKGTFVLKQ